MQFDGQSWRHRDNVAGTSEPVYLPHRGPASVAVSPAVGANAVVEFTLSSRDEVEAGTALWRAWSLGTVTQAADDALQAPVTALRCTSTGGSTSFEVLA